MYSPISERRLPLLFHYKLLTTHTLKMFELEECDINTMRLEIIESRLSVQHVDRLTPFSHLLANFFKTSKSFKKSQGVITDVFYVVE